MKNDDSNKQSKLYPKIHYYKIYNHNHEIESPNYDKNNHNYRIL